jgi:hypothetical protein
MPSQTLAYIRLVNSNDSLDKRFRVLFQNRDVGPAAQRSIRRGVTGKLIVTQGVRKREWDLVLKIYETDPLTGSGYGNLADLETFFNLANPAATPSDVITLYDNYDANGDGTGDQYTVKITSAKLPYAAMSPLLTGANAWGRVPIQFMEV